MQQPEISIHPLIGRLQYNYNKAPHLHVFSLFFTHFKWSKPGLKQNCEASLSPINQDFLESCQCTAVADK